MTTTITPAPSPEEMARLLDEMLLDILVNGEEVWTGQLTEQRQPIFIRKRPSAAMIGKIIDRLKDVKRGVYASSKAANLLEEARRRGIGGSGAFKFPAGESA